MATYGLGGTGESQQDWVKKTNYQQQTPYAAKNRMFQTTSAGQAQQYPAPTATGTSPVNGDGTVNTQNQPFSANLTGGPTLEGGQTGAALASAAQTAANNVPTGPTVFQPSQLPTTGYANYQTGQFSQFQAPNQGGTEAAQQALLNSILTGGGSLNPMVVAQMKEANKEGLLQQYQQDADARSATQAARGTYGGGTSQAADLMAQALRDQNLMSGNRAIDVQAATTNRQDLLNALTAADQTLNAQLGRATTGYTTGLQGQTAQTAENQFGYNAANTAVNYALQQAIQQAQLNEAGATSAQNDYQTRMNNLVQLLGLLQSADQSQMNNALGWGALAGTLSNGG